MPRCRGFTTHQVLSMLEDDSEMNGADIFISPPLDPDCSDEDSGDECEGTVDNLTRRQLEATAEVTVRHGSERIRIGIDSPAPTIDEPAEHEPNVIPICSTPFASHENVAQETSTSSAVEATQESITSTVRSSKRLSKPSQRLRESMPLSAVDSNISETRKRKTAVPALCKVVEAQPAAKKKSSMQVTRAWVKDDIPKTQDAVASAVVKRYANSDFSPSFVFEMFMDEKVIELLVENTNRYASQKGKHNFQTTSGEIMLFIAILFTSGYATLPRRRLYWEPSDDVHNTAISNAMTRNRFEELMRFIHVADNDNLPAGDRMGKVRPLFSELNARFLHYFPCAKDLSIDESMVPYYGRHSAKQYIRGKPIRFGYKVWSLNTPVGYCIQLDPYQGAGVTDPQLGLGGSVVVNLVSKLPTGSYVLYFDNFFTSLKLLQHLTDRGIQATGTVRSNRIENCPVTSVDVLKKQPRGSMDYRLDSQKSVIVVRWNDNSVVTLASNCHGIEPMGSAQRWSHAEKKRVSIDQPYVITMYNANMGGVDRMDQNVSTYRISIRSKKWWWPLFAYLLDVAMQNSWLVYRLTEGAKRQPLDQLDFRRDICNLYYKRYAMERSTVGRMPGRPKPMDKRVPVELRTDSVGHYLQQSQTQRRCSVCGRKVRKKCQKCDVGLHMNCFVSFHQS